MSAHAAGPEHPGRSLERSLSTALGGDHPPALGAMLRFYAFAGSSVVLLVLLVVMAVIDAGR